MSRKLILNRFNRVHVADIAVALVACAATSAGLSHAALLPVQGPQQFHSESVEGSGAAIPLVDNLVDVPIHSSGVIKDVYKWPSTQPAITADGDNSDWPAWQSTFTSPGTSPGVAVGVVAVEYKVAQPDNMFLYMRVNFGEGAAAVDNVILTLDVKHLHDINDARGLRFKRAGTVDVVSGDPGGAGTAHAEAGCGGAGRICVLALPDGSLAIEARLVPQDFGLGTEAFAGEVGAFVRAQDMNSASVWPGGALVSAPDSWAHLNLGSAIDLVLVLDKSGSMSGPACPSSAPPSCSDTRTKFELLQDAVHFALDAFAAVSVPVDSFALRYFGSVVDEFPTNGKLTGAPTVPSAKGDVTSRSPGSATAMGAGLQSAIDVLDHSVFPKRSRRVILFTDGMQNVSPLVVDPAPDDPCTSTSELTIDNSTTLDGNLEIGINTIGIGATEPYLELLCKIAHVTDGTNYSSIDLGSGLNEQFFKQMIDEFRDNSPQLIAYRRGSVASGGSTESFQANRTLQKLVFALSWRGRDSLSFRVEKNGIDVTAAGQIITEPKHRVFAMHVPTTVDGVVVDGEGSWDVEIEGPVNAQYDVAAVGDDYALDYRFSIEGQSVVGQPLKLTAKAGVFGHPITDASIIATVLKPGLGIGTLLSVNATPPPIVDITPEPGASAAQTKLELLLHDEAAYESIQPVGSQVVLESNGVGTYSAEFTGTDVTGVYTVNFSMTGQDNILGAFSREASSSRHVRFETADPDLSELRAVWVSGGPEGPTHVIRVRPQDRFGNFLGPDYSHQVGVKLSEGVVQTINDLVNGSYEAVIAVPNDADPIVEISVMGQSLFERRLSTILPRRALTVISGAAIPNGSFGSTFNPGFNMIVGGGYYVDPKIFVGVLAGYNQFQPSSPAQDGTYWINVSGNLRYLPVRTTLSPYIGAGPGLYIPESGAAQSGVHVGGGFVYHVGSYTVEAGADYHSVFNTSTEFVHVHAGFSVLF